MSLPFATSEQSTLGIEWELALVDRESGELVPAAHQVLAGIEAKFPEIHEDPAHPWVKKELLLNTVELVTGVCRTVSEATGQLTEAMNAVREIIDPMGLDVFCAGSHPFDVPATQLVTNAERYQKLIDRTQWWGRQMLIWGVHVHVGLDDVNKAMPVMNGLLNYFPHFQAISASSPFWEGEDTGYASQRALMFQQLPTAGLPFQFRTWEGYEAYVRDMMTTGVIDDVSEIRWDIRPAANLGTIEMRVCDGVSTAREIGAIAALTQCLVQDFSDRLEAGETLPTMPQWHVQENKWRAARYGLDAIIITDAAGNEELVTEHLAREVERLAPVASRLGCAQELQDVTWIMEFGAGYQRQHEVAAAAGGDLRAVVRYLVDQMRGGV